MIDGPSYVIGVMSSDVTDWYGPSDGERGMAGSREDAAGKQAAVVTIVH